jgi:hypothetical protein
MKTDTKELAAGLRELADLMLKGSGNALMHEAADRLEELQSDSDSWWDMARSRKLQADAAIRELAAHKDAMIAARKAER